MCNLFCSAQVIVNPVFDRTDVFKFRVEKVDITKDTTYVFCKYNAEEYSWANVSREMYIEDTATGKRYQIVKVTGLPFSPDKRHFTDEEKIEVVLYFPHVSTDKINIIENEEKEAFNIYGIDLKHAYDLSYTPEDIHFYFKSYDKFDKEENWNSALEAAQKQLEATNYVEGIRSFASACSVNNMIMSYFELGEYGKVIEWGQKTIDILRELPQDSIYLDLLARTYNNVGGAYRLLKQIDKASTYEELSLTTRRFGDGIGRLTYEEYLTHLAPQYYREGNYPKALLYGREIVDIYKKKYEKNTYKFGCIYLETLCNLCEYYRAMGQPKEAIKCGQKALDLFDEGVCSDEKGLRHWLYNNLAGALASDNQADEAITYLNRILSAASNNQIEIHFLNKDKSELILAARSLLASIYLQDKKDTLRAEKEYEAILKASIDNIVALEQLYEINRWKDPDKAMTYLDKAINVEGSRSKNSMLYADLLLKHIRNTWVKKLMEDDAENVLDDIKTAVNIIKRYINNTSYTMSRNERRAYWQRYEYVFTWLIPTISGILKTPAACKLAYDAALFYKGLLLSSEKEFKNVIAEEGDSSLTAIYNDYVRNISLIEEQYTKGASPLLTDSLKKIINDEEYTLCLKVSRFNRQYKGTNLNWNEIRDRLKEGEAAIEIVSYRNVRNDNTRYDAYVIGHNSESPKYFPLCWESDLKDCMSSDSIDYTGLSILIWGGDELESELKKYETLYISPAGLINSIGIEYLPIQGNRCISDRFNILRVSSTREVCNSHRPLNIKRACLFGGLDYDSERTGVVEQERSQFAISRAVEKAIIERGGFEPLYGSKIEVEVIKDEMLKGGANSVSLYMGMDGTEGCFKNLSRTSTDVLHVSTHGLYVPFDSTNINQSANFPFMLSDNNFIIDEETQLLTRSFLVMSGGNLLMKGKGNWNSRINEDEILTALEISHLDFYDLDLVVLSACQTALGTFDTDGVYGLQRGFKKAGAHTILMSLDKVDDDATKILMVEFYRNLMDGKTKLQSLRNAQKHLRIVENGKYDSPKYWASFILLDGLN